MKRHLQSGLTLVELLVAISILTLLILAAGTLYVTVIRQQVGDRLVQNLQREVDRMTAHVERNVATSTEVSGSTTCNLQATDRIDLDSPDGMLSYQRNGSRLEFSKAGSIEEVSSPGIAVSGVRFFPTCDGTRLVSVKFEATLTKSAGGQTKTTSISTTTGTRPQ
ncbi:MAG TPA: type II secretion system protein [Patescibacteria group bacterium]|jgi:prepilin-type N-terminal cleavage/methylation domain-containing protein